MTPGSGPVTAINGAQSKYLDVVRGLAAQLVLLHHAAGYALPASGLGDLGLGALGVLTFFLLSGFLIADNIQSRLSTGSFSLTEFTISRFTRIFLPYVPAILLVAVLDQATVLSPVYEYVADFTWSTAVANLFMFQDYPLFQILRRLHVPDQPWFFKTFGSGRQFWTVSIEWWIYLTAGLGTYLALHRRTPSVAMLLLLGFVAVEPLYNLVGGPGDSLTLTWLMGAAANVAYRRVAAGQVGHVQGLWWKGIWCAVAVLAATRLFFTHGRIYDPVFALLFAGLLFLPMAMLLCLHNPGPWRWLGLNRLSFHSYSLYLTHGSIVLFLLARYGQAVMGWRGLALLVVASNLAALPFAVLFEMPHRRVRRMMLRAFTPHVPVTLHGLTPTAKFMDR